MLSIAVFTSNMFVYSFQICFYAKEQIYTLFFYETPRGIVYICKSLWIFALKSKLFWNLEFGFFFLFLFYEAISSPPPDLQPENVFLFSQDALKNTDGIDNIKKVLR